MRLSNLRVQQQGAKYLLVIDDTNGISRAIATYYSQPTSEQARRDFEIWFDGFRTAISEIAAALSTNLDSTTAQKIVNGSITGTGNILFKTPVPHDAPKPVRHRTVSTPAIKPEEPTIKFRKGRSHE